MVSATWKGEAEDEDAAADAALDAMPGLCIHCAGGTMVSKPYSVDLGEYDLAKDEYERGKLVTPAIEEIDEP